MNSRSRSAASTIGGASRRQRSGLVAGGRHRSHQRSPASSGTRHPRGRRPQDGNPSQLESLAITVESRSRSVPRCRSATALRLLNAWSPTCSSIWRLAPSCFTPPTGTAYADLADRWPPRNLADPQPTLSGLVAPPLLRGDRRRAERSGASTRRLICSRRGPSSMVPSARSTSASPSTTAASISISPTIVGERSRSDPTAGRSSRSRRCAFAGLPGCCRCRSRSAGGSIDELCVIPQSRETKTILSWSAAWLLAALRPRAPIRSWRSRASRARPKPCSPRSSGP